MSKDLNVPMLVLSQLNRAPETRQGDHRPQLSDLRESGSIEQDADVVAFIFREEVYKPDREDLRGQAELLVAKQRNGPVGKVRWSFSTVSPSSKIAPRISARRCLRPPRVKQSPGNKKYHRRDAESAENQWK